VVVDDVFDVQHGKRNAHDSSDLTDGEQFMKAGS
jgi:hypothetical protein